MNPRDEIEVIRRRIGAAEYELEQLKQRLGRIESHLATMPSPAVTAAPAPIAPPIVVAPPVVAEPPPLPPQPVAPPPLPPVVFAPQPPVRPVAVASAPAGPGALREFLEPLQLWPPSGEEDTEVRLAAWWATRVGALLAVIGVVFLGIYVSRNSPPWVRLAEVSAVTVGVLALGGWLERKLPKFGAVVFGAGLALTYFCAFAAYGVPAMKVLADPLAAMTLQIAAVGAIFVAAWWRNTPVVATMAVALGYVTAFLALRQGTSGFGPWVVLVLGVAAVVLRHVRDWAAPSGLAMPLAWVFLARFALGNFSVGLGEALFWAALYFALFMARDWLGALRGRELSTIDRAVQVTNSTLAVAVGWLAAAEHAPGVALERFYFGAGLVMLAVAWAWRAVNVGKLVPVFVCKGAGLIALGVIASFDGQARSLVLLAQAFVMLVSAAHSHVRGLRVATVVTAVVSLLFFAGESNVGADAIWSGTTLAETAWLAGALLFVAAAQRWLGWNTLATALGACVVGLVAVFTASSWNAFGWTPTAYVGLALIVAGAAACVRGWLPAGIAAGMLVVAAHVELVGWRDGGGHPADRLWLNELVLLATALAAGFGIERIRDGTQRPALRWPLAALALATLVIVFFKGLAAAPALAAATALAVALVAAAAALPRWPCAALSTPVVGLGVVAYVGASVVKPDMPVWLWGAAALTWTAPCWLVVSHARRDTIAPAIWRAVALPLQTALATIVSFLAAGKNLEGNAMLAVTAGFALAALGFAIRPGLRPALEASWVFWLAAIAGIADVDAMPLGGLVALASWAPALVLRHWPATAPLQVAPPPWRAWSSGVQVLLAALAGFVFAAQFAGSRQLFVLAGVIGVAFAVWRWGRVAAARWAACSLAIAAWLLALEFAATPGAQGWSRGLVATLGIAALMAFLPFAVERDFDAGARRGVRWGAAAAGLVLAFVVFVVQRGAVAPYATVGCGLAAVAWFLAGLFARSRPHRLVGLGGLALCIARAFAVDLSSALHRIVAFVALGVVLLWVGFSYHRFRHLIVDDEKKL